MYVSYVPPLLSTRSPFPLLLQLSLLLLLLVVLQGRYMCSGAYGRVGIVVIRRRRRRWIFSLSLFHTLLLLGLVSFASQNSKPTRGEKRRANRERERARGDRTSGTYELRPAPCSLQIIPLRCGRKWTTCLFNWLASQLWQLAK